MKLSQLYILIAILITIHFLIPQKAKSCYAIVAGKDATKDGSVLVAHSELNKPDECFLNFRAIPRIKHSDSARIQLKYGGSYPDVNESYSYLWSENFGLEGSDGVMNEHGVVCVSNGTPSKLDSLEKLKAQGQIEKGGAGFRMRIEVARRAQTAREGVKIVANMIEEFGSLHAVHFVIADAKEAWIMALAKGKQWVAKRVPDDKVAIVPNVNTIQEVNLQDTANYMASENLIDYAIENNLYDPQEDGNFNYKKAYGKPRWTGKFYEKYNTDPRQWRAQWLITGEKTKLPPEGYLPFAVKPEEKLGLKDLRKIMSDHMEDTQFDKSNNYKKGSPHDLMGPRKGAICGERNQEVALFQLRDWMPSEIGCVYWRSTAAVCSSVLTPWYAGINQTPESYHIDVPPEKNVKTSFHFNPPENIFEYDENKAFWIFNTLENLVDINYKKNIQKVKPVWNKFEEKEFSMQKPIEEKALELYKQDPEKASKWLTQYCNGRALKARAIAQQLIQELRTENFGY